jgi:hypothetical protein
LSAVECQRLVWLALATVAPLAAAPSPSPLAPLPNPELPTLDGGHSTLLSEAGEVSVFLFARPGQEHSTRAIRELAGCAADFAGKPVRLVVVVSGSVPPAEVNAAVAEAGLKVPVLLDVGDSLYDLLGVRLHPLVGVADQKQRLAAWMPYQAVNYCDAVKARVRFLLGEIDEAALAKVLAPPRAGMPGASSAGVASRDVNLGRLQLERGDGDKALASARKALARAPDSGPAHALAARALAALGRCPEAAPEIEAALRVDPNDREALAAKAACAR